MYVMHLRSPAGGFQKVEVGTGRIEGFLGVDWLPGDRLVFSGGSSELPQLWTANADGSRRDRVRGADPLRVRSFLGFELQKFRTGSRCCPAAAHDGSRGRDRPRNARFV